MSKTRLNELNEEIGKIWEEILTIISENPSIMVYFEKDGMAQSSSSFVDQFNERFQYARRQLRKIAEKIPSRRGRKKK